MSALTIVIVNYRTAGLVLDCLRSLSTQVEGRPDCRVVVVDSFSGDGSVERLRAAVTAADWGRWVEILPLSENAGFAAGNNAALRRALAGSHCPDYLWLLNPDTVVRPGALHGLLQFMEAHPEVGIAGSRLEDPDGTPQRSAFRFPGIASEFERGMRLGVLSNLLRRQVVAPVLRDRAHRTDWVSGASMMVRREVIESIGFLDDRYFLYYEETDYCLRARRARWDCWYVPQSRVVHLVGQSSGIKDGVPTARRVPGYWFQSRSRYFGKNHGLLYRLLADATWVAGFVCWRLRRRLQRKPDHDPPALLWDFLRFTYSRPERA
jgi:GT2 family glycosyltransferase